MSPVLRRAKKKADERVVTLIGKPGCHLCDDARAVVEEVCTETGASWEEKDITRTRRCTGRTGSRFRSSWSTASSTRSGVSTRDGCAALGA